MMVMLIPRSARDVTGDRQEAKGKRERRDTHRERDREREGTHLPGKSARSQKRCEGKQKTGPGITVPNPHYSSAPPRPRGSGEGVRTEQRSGLSGPSTYDFLLTHWFVSAGEDQGSGFLSSSTSSASSNPDFVPSGGREEEHPPRGSRAALPSCSPAGLLCRGRKRGRAGAKLRRCVDWVIRRRPRPGVDRRVE